VNINTFFANFGYLADAPNGVKKLRELILQLAVQGKLVPQYPNDEPASKLLARIKAEKARLLKEKKIKNADPLPPIGTDEVPYELPHGWAWEKLGNYCLITMGQSPESKFYNTHGEGLPFYQGKSEFGKIYPSPRVWCAQPQKIADKDDILISVRAPVGPTNVCPDRSCIGRGLAAINALNSNHFYLLFCLRAFEKQIAEKGVGSTFVAISRADLDQLPIPVPPIAEQHRIVSKVDQLMSLCDELEARQQKKKQKLVNLNNAALDRLLTAREPDDFATARCLIRDNFDFLYTAPETITKLRQGILQLAVQGKLVPQDPNDEPASVLLAKIKAEKERLVKEKKSRKTDTLPQVSPSEAPFELPKGWEWIHLDEISINVHYGYTASADHNRKDVRLLRITDIQNGRVNWDGVPGCEIDDRNLPIYALKNNDLLIARTGGTIGKTFLVEGLEVCAVFASYLIRVIPSGFIVPRYLKQFTDSPLYWFQLYEKSMGTGQPNVNSVALRSLIFPLPSYAEQHRIVTKVDQLMKLCDELEDKLIKSQAKSEKLVAAAVKAIVSIEDCITIKNVNMGAQI